MAASLVWFRLFAGSLAITDTLLGITGCVKDSPVTALPSCDSFVNVTNVCGDMKWAERQGCMCNQAFFDTIYE
jgi:hypothetical protein